MGVEPTLSAWEAGVLPMNYIRVYWEYNTGMQKVQGQNSRIFRALARSCASPLDKGGTRDYPFPVFRLFFFVALLAICFSSLPQSPVVAEQAVYAYRAGSLQIRFIGQHQIQIFLVEFHSAVGANDHTDPSLSFSSQIFMAIGRRKAKKLFAQQSSNAGSPFCFRLLQ